MAAQSLLAGWIFVSLFPIHLGIVAVGEVRTGLASVLKLKQYEIEVAIYLEHSTHIQFNDIIW